MKKSILFSVIFFKFFIIHGAVLPLPDNFMRFLSISRSESKDSISTIDYNTFSSSLKSFEHVPNYEENRATPTFTMSYSVFSEHQNPVDVPHLVSNPSCCAFIGNITSQTAESFRKDIKNPGRSCLNCVQCKSDHPRSVQICRKNICFAAGQCLCCAGVAVAML